MNDITLQINLSPGDLSYARQTVPALVDANRRWVSESLAVVDLCRPQRTQVLDPDTRFPEPEFSRRIAETRTMAEDLRRAGYFDRIFYMEPGCEYFSLLSRKYSRGIVRETHACRGMGFMSYLLMFELPRTRYVLHYDADMIQYQKPGYHWPTDAIQRMAGWNDAVAGSCQVHPPRCVSSRRDEPSFIRVDWFSTRCFVFDIDKLNPYLPLVKGKRYIELLLRRLFQRSYPPDPEILLFHTLCPLGCWRLDLTSHDAWILHPDQKDVRFVAQLPEILHSVADGKFPEDQRGRENVILESWSKFLKRSASAAPAV